MPDDALGMTGAYSRACSKRLVALLLPARAQLNAFATAQQPNCSDTLQDAESALNLLPQVAFNQYFGTARQSQPWHRL